MDFFLGMIVGGISVGLIIWLVILVKGGKTGSQKVVADGNPSPNIEAKKANLAELEELISKQDKITNAEVEKLLGVSDATAERYLQELEKAGKIRQVDAGKETYYEKI